MSSCTSGAKQVERRVVCTMTFSGKNGGGNFNNFGTALNVEHVPIVGGVASDENLRVR